MPDYQTVPGNILLLLLQLGCTTNQRSIPLAYLLHMLSQAYHGPIQYFLELFSVYSDAERSRACGSGVFTADEVDGVGDKGSQGTTMVSFKTLLPKPLNLTLFSSTSQVSGFPVPASRLKEYYCIKTKRNCNEKLLNC